MNCEIQGLQDKTGLVGGAGVGGLASTSSHDATAGAGVIAGSGAAPTPEPNLDVRAALASTNEAAPMASASGGITKLSGTIFGGGGASMLLGARGCGGGRAA